MEANPIETWWPQMPVTAKEWLRTNLRSDKLPDSVRGAIQQAGGPAQHAEGSSVLLSSDDWTFIETQSEFVD